MPEMQPNRQGPEDLPFGPRSEWGRALSLREAASWLQHGTRQADRPTADAPEGPQSGPDAAEETLAPELDVCRWQRDPCLHQSDPFAEHSALFKVISPSVIQVFVLLSHQRVEFVCVQ